MTKIILTYLTVNLPIVSTKFVHTWHFKSHVIVQKTLLKKHAFPSISLQLIFDELSNKSFISFLDSSGEGIHS